MVDVEVEVAGWEHGRCGPAVERHQVVDLGCLSASGDDGGIVLSETRHHVEPELRVRGRVCDIRVVRDGRPAEPVLRVPSGRVLRGFDPEDDGHLEEPWSTEPVEGGEDFLVVVRTSG